MFVQSRHFVEKHQTDGDSLYVYGQEKTGDTVKLAKMNLAVNGIRGEIKCLQATRDLLLPRLISGKLSVKDLDICGILNENKYRRQ